MTKLKEKERECDAILKEYNKLKSENTTLHRLNGDYKSEATHATEELKSLQSEFSVRLDKEEQRVTQFRKERDLLRKQLDGASSQSSGQNEEIAKQLKDKDEKYQSLLKEGTTLSNKILQMEENTKKMRLKVKEVEDKNVALNATIVDQQKTINDKQAVIDRLNSSSGNQGEQIGALRGTIDQLKTELQVKATTISENQVQIDKLRRDYAQIKNEREDFAQTVNKMKQEFSLEDKNRLIKTVEEFELREKENVKTIKGLQETLTALNDSMENKVKVLKHELESVTNRCIMAESKNEEILSTTPNYTKPLLEQVKHLETTFALKEEQFKQEKSEIQTNMKMMENNVKIAHRDKQKMAGTLAENEKFWNDKIAKMKQVYEENEKTQRGTIDSLQSKIQTMLNENASLLEKVKQNSEPRVIIPLLFDRKESPQLPSPSSPKLNPDDKSQTSTYILKLEEQLRYQGTQIQSLLDQSKEHESSKLKMAEDMIDYSQKNRELLLTLDKFTSEREELQKLKLRHDIALQLIGEREERISELQNEFHDVKEMFRQQIDQLMKK